MQEKQSVLEELMKSAETKWEISRKIVQITTEESLI